MEILAQRLGDQIDQYILPPQIFELMRGEILDIDIEEISLSRATRLSESLSNHAGGLVTEAVDNTIGPLSFPVAPLNVTRRLEMKYSRPISEDIETIHVEAKLQASQGRKLTFTAEVRDQSRRLLARGQALHWIVDENDD
jgi:hypothetical protein